MLTFTHNEHKNIGNYNKKDENFINQSDKKKNISNFLIPIENVVKQTEKSSIIYISDGYAISLSNKFIFNSKDNRFIKIGLIKHYKIILYTIIGGTIKVTRVKCESIFNRVIPLSQHCYDILTLERTKMLNKLMRKAERKNNFYFDDETKKQLSEINNAVSNFVERNKVSYQIKDITRRNEISEKIESMREKNALDIGKVLDILNGKQIIFD